MGLCLGLVAVFCGACYLDIICPRQIYYMELHVGKLYSYSDGLLLEDMSCFIEPNEMFILLEMLKPPCLHPFGGLKILTTKGKLGVVYITFPEKLKLVEIKES